MFSKEALEHLESKLSAQNIAPIDGMAVLPGNHQLVSTEKYQKLRNRYRGQLKTDSLNGFADYVNTFNDDPGAEQAKLFVDKQEMNAIAFFNLGTHDLPGHGDHTALLLMNPRAEYKSAVAMNGKAPSQRDLAEWLEDYAPYITAFDANNEAMTSAEAAYAVRNLTIGTTSQVESNQGNTGHAMSAMEAVEAKSRGKLPTSLTFTCIPYDGMNEQVLTIRLVTAGQKDGPMFRTRIVGYEVLQEQIATDFCLLLAEKTDIEPVIGWFTP